MKETRNSRTENHLRIAGLTILLRAAPVSPNLFALQPHDAQAVVDSLSSPALFRELPAQQVRLTAFNLDQSLKPSVAGRLWRVRCGFGK